MNVFTLQDTLQQDTCTNQTFEISGVNVNIRWSIKLELRPPSCEWKTSLFSSQFQAIFNHFQLFIFLNFLLCFSSWSQLYLGIKFAAGCWWFMKNEMKNDGICDNKFVIGIATLWLRVKEYRIKKMLLIAKFIFFLGL